MSHDVLKTHWFILPLLSGALLTLSSYPYNLWPLAFVALVPLYFFAAKVENRPLRRVFIGGCIAGGMFVLPLSFIMVSSFQWMPDAHIFTALVRGSFVLVTALGALCCGLAALTYRLLRSRSTLLSSLLAAAVYVSGEIILYKLYGGYSFGILAYAGTSIHALMLSSSVGGMFFVSFIIAWINILLAEAFAAPSWRRAAPALVFLAGIAACLFAGNIVDYLRPRAGAGGQGLSVAVVQLGDTARRFKLVGKEEGGTFSLPAAEKLLAQAAKDTPDLVIYPFSPVGGILYDTEKPTPPYGIATAHKGAVAAWLSSLVPASTTVAIWTEYYQAPEYTSELEFFKNGASTEAYQKRGISPFIDYTPQWAQRVGIRTTFEDIQPGDAVQTITFGDIEAGGIICSEIYQQDIVRADAGRVSIVISAGSEGFAGSVVRTLSLKAAQFRAAENSIPIVRANLLGPSAIIDRNGSIVAQAAIDTDQILRGTLEPKISSPGIFSRFGNTPLYFLFCFIAAAAIVARRRHS